MATTQALPEVSAGARPPSRVGARLAYFLMFLGLLALGATGIGTFALGQAPMSQWILMLHVGASPLFSMGLALVALSWRVYGSARSGVSRFLFWWLLLGGLVVILSGVLPMTPLTGTEGQHTLYLVHRYGAIAVAVIAVLHFLSPKAPR